MSAILELERLTAGYDGAAVVRDLNLCVGEGEIVALLGPNGSGKTTTLRAISGIVKPMGGSIRLNGEALARTLNQWDKRGKAEGHFCGLIEEAELKTAKPASVLQKRRSK